MAPPTFSLRWESTGDKWWYASPIDWAAANGHYDLVRELLRLDGNHLIKLTSLRRVRRLEAVWDDEEQYHDVAKCRCEVARQLFDECHAQKKEGKNSLIVAGYGGWLLYTAASAGDLSFVQKLLRVNPLLVFGDGEYGLTDILYAAARSKNLKVFRVIYGFARSPRFNRGDEEEQIKEILPLDFKMELKNRAVHAAARGGNLMGLKELLTHFGDVLEYRDVNGSTVLHAAAGRGQLEVVIYLIASYDKIISFTDNEGNTPLHIAAYRGQLPVLEALVQSSPSSASLVNNVGNTFLHMAVAGFHTPAFRRLDRQIELIKQLLSNKCFNIETVINIQNNDGKTALHLAIMGGNDHCNLGGLLMGCREINVNIRDDRGMTPLDYLKRQRRSPSSDMLIRRLVSVGGVSTFKKLDDAVRKAFASHLKMQSMCSSSSPGASFRVPDSEIFQTTGIDRLLNPCLDKVVVSAHFRSLSEASQCESASVNVKKSGTLHSAKKRLKTMLHWRPVLRRKDQKDMTASEETPPIPLRERFSTNKRTLAVRSNISSPTNRKKFASGVAFGILQDQTLVSISTSFPRSSLSSYSSVEKGKGVISMVDETARPSCSRHMNDHYSDASNVIRRQGSLDKRFVNPSLWFRGHHISIKNPMGKPSIKQPVPLAV